MELDLTEEDQMLRAIAMSLGEKIMADCDRKDATKHKQAKEVCSAVLCFSIVCHIYMCENFNIVCNSALGT